MFEQIQEYISQVPKPVLIGVALVVVALVGFFLWKKFSSKDSENEVIKGAQQAGEYARNIQQGLEREDEPLMSAMTNEYVQEVQTGLQDLEEEPPVPVAAASADDDEDSDLEDYA